MLFKVKALKEGAIGGLVGLGGGAAGTSFNTTNPVSGSSLGTANNQSQVALQQQQQLLSALQGQNGISNQSQIYNQLQGVVNGTGPNPAMAQLNQTTGQNVANQAALMAGQRGAAANPALIARQAAQQGANVQQQAVGQGATMQANQALSALGQAGNVANTQVANQVGATGANTGAALNYQSNLLGAQGQYNNVQGQLANTQLQGQQGLMGGIMSGFGAASSLGAEGGEVGDDSTPTFGPGVSSFSGGLGGFGGQHNSGGALKLLALADGGGVQYGPASSFGQFLTNMANSGSPTFGSDAGAAELQKGVSSAIKGSPQKPTATAEEMASGPQTAYAGSDTSDMSGMAANGGKVSALLSPGEEYLSPKAVQAVKQGANPMSAGKTIPGKPKVGGAKNSYANDTVPARLDKGGIVLPRSVTQSKNAPKAAHDFVAKILAKGKC